MDVIGLDRAGIAEVAAPNGTALTEAQLERMWRLEPAPILCFYGDSAGQKAAIRAALRALPHIGPERTLRFVELPAGQDPDDLVKSGGRPAVEALLEKPEGLADRLWRYELGQAPLETPEARAAVRQRLLDHCSTITDPALRRLYRDEWLGRFEEQFARARPAFQHHGQQRGQQPQQRRGTFVKGRFVPPEPPTSEGARAIGRSGIDATTARALILGFTNFPEELPTHCELLAGLAIPDPATARLRDQLVDAAFLGLALDREGLATILAGDGAAGGIAGRTSLGFSFTRRDSDPARAREDLAAAVEIIAAAEEVEKSLDYATERLKRDFTDEAYEEQQRLIEAQQRLNQRLASLAGSD